jgi:hypothetical protein
MPRSYPIPLAPSLRFRDNALGDFRCETRQPGGALPKGQPSGECPMRCHRSFCLLLAAAACWPLAANAQLATKSCPQWPHSKQLKDCLVFPNAHFVVGSVSPGHQWLVTMSAVWLWNSTSNDRRIYVVALNTQGIRAGSGSQIPTPAPVHFTVTPKRRPDTGNRWKAQGQACLPPPPAGYSYKIDVAKTQLGPGSYWVVYKEIIDQVNCPQHP